MSEVTAPAPYSNGALLSFIERASRDPDFDIAKFESLLRMQREVVQEQERREFNRAMAEAQTEMAPVVRDAQNTHTNSKYAKLEAIDNALRPVYTRHGFSVRFGSAPSPNDGWLRIVCTVSHTGGYSETNYLDSPPDGAGSGGRSNKSPVQAVGSTVTYLRRYLLAMVFNVVLANDDDDDDGNRLGPRRPDAAWRNWLDKLKQAMVGLNADAIAELADRASIKDAIDNGPKWVREETSALLTEAFAKAKEDIGGDAAA